MIYESVIFGVGCIIAMLIGKTLYYLWLSQERNKIKSIIVDWGWDKQQVDEAMSTSNFPITRDFVYEKMEEL